MAKAASDNAFQNDAATTRNARSPRVDYHVEVTVTSVVEAESFVSAVELCQPCV